MKYNNNKNRSLKAMLKKTFGEGTTGKSINPLSANCHAGRKKICKINGDRKMCAKMASMGFYPGEEIYLICGERNARCVLRVGGGTISLDEAASKSILVESL